MARRSEQLQIRVTAQEKAALKRAARAAGLDVSAFVLSRALPQQRTRFSELVEMLRAESARRFVLAEMHDLLVALSPAEFPQAVASLELQALSPMLQNYVAAMIEQSAHDKHVAAPAWVRRIPPLDHPHFATTLRSVRPYLLRATPVPFRRRNIFTDAGIGARV